MSKYPVRFVIQLTSGVPGKKTSHSRDLYYFDTLIWEVYNDKDSGLANNNNNNNNFFYKRITYLACTGMPV